MLLKKYSYLHFKLKIHVLNYNLNIINFFYRKLYPILIIYVAMHIITLLNYDILQDISRLFTK